MIQAVQKFLKRFRKIDPRHQAMADFQTPHYLCHNKARQDHLATLDLSLDGKTVLEVGAGVGDHTQFFINRKCKVTSSDGRPELVEIIKARYPSISTCVWDLESRAPEQIKPHQVTYCYGVLYHVKNPDFLLENLAKLTTELLLLETCVSFGKELNINVVNELDNPTQSFSGEGCRPTRSWIFNKLKELFPYVYVTVTQPRHPEFPVDWNGKGDPASCSRSVFVASNSPLKLDGLSETLLMEQTRS